MAPCHSITAIPSPLGRGHQRSDGGSKRVRGFDSGAAARSGGAGASAARGWLGGEEQQHRGPTARHVTTQVVRNPLQMQLILGAEGTRCEAEKPLLQPLDSPAAWQPPAGWAQAHLGDGGCWDLRGTLPGVTSTIPLSGGQQQGNNSRGRQKKSAWLACQLGNASAGLPPARKPQGRDRATMSCSDPQQRDVSFWARGGWAGVGSRCWCCVR